MRLSGTQRRGLPQAVKTDPSRYWMPRDLLKSQGVQGKRKNSRSYVRLDAARSARALSDDAGFTVVKGKQQILCMPARREICKTMQKLREEKEKCRSWEQIQDKGSAVSADGTDIPWELTSQQSNKKQERHLPERPASTP